MWFKSLICLCALIIVEVLVKCDELLCTSGPKIDSIAFVSTTNYYFFTSGGLYWYTDRNRFPPKEAGKKLPGGFLRGDAAIFMNTLDGCKSSARTVRNVTYEQLVHVIEFVNNENRIMTFDLRNGQWTDPVRYDQLNGFGQAKIDWSKKIDAAFNYKMLFIVVIQEKKYSMVNLNPLCTDPNGFGNGSTSRDTTDLNADPNGSIDGTTILKENTFLLFMGELFWEVDVVVSGTKPAEGILKTTKNAQKDIKTDFFKFPENCHLPPEEAATPAPVFPDSTDMVNTKGGAGGSGGSGGPQNVSNPNETSELEPDSDSDPSTDKKYSDVPVGSPTKEGVETGQSKKKSGFPWIIVVIVIIIIVIAVIALIVCLAMKTSTSGDKEKGAEAGGTGGAGTGSAGAGTAVAKTEGLSAGPSSKSDSISSQMSVRSASVGSASGGSKAAVGAAGGTGKVDDSQGLKLSNSSLGSSPSTMSTRSVVGGQQMGK